MTWNGIADALGSIPDLEGAACRGRAELFDASQPDRIGEAQAICHGCPALARCRDWLAHLPRRSRPVGVVAAKVVREVPAPVEAPRRVTAVDRATDWLADYLDAHGSALSIVVKAAAVDAGIAVSALQSARGRLGVVIEQGDSIVSPTTWRLPRSRPDGPRGNEIHPNEGMTA